MSCKAGGLVLLRHNDVAGEWHRLCAQAMTPAVVSDEPLIHSGRDLQVRANSESTEAPPEIRGDVAAHGFWRRGVFFSRCSEPCMGHHTLKPSDKHVQHYV